MLVTPTSPDRHRDDERRDARTEAHRMVLDPEEDQSDPRQDEPLGPEDRLVGDGPGIATVVVVADCQP